MTGITIGPDGNHEPRRHTAQRRVKYRMVIECDMTADEAADFDSAVDVTVKLPMVQTFGVLKELGVVE